MGERLNGIQEVRGSIPLGSTKAIACGENFRFPWAETVLTDSKPKTQYCVRYMRAVKDKMTLKGRTRLVPTITVDPGYGLRVESLSKGMVAAFGATIDLSPKNTCIVSLADNEPSRLAFYRVGAALRNSFGKARVKPG